MKASKTSKRAAAKAAEALYQLKITLKWSQPPIWRRVVVGAGDTLSRLHDIIQSSMGWGNCHMHEFVTRTSRYGEAREGSPEVLEEQDHTLVDIAPAAKSKFQYEYDFGDSWLHEIAVEKILPPDAGFKRPVCVAGGNACPPDDCGGLDGYEHMLEVVADPKHPEHDEILEWLDSEFNPAEFSLEAVNKRLKALQR